MNNILGKIKDFFTGETSTLLSYTPGNLWNDYYLNTGRMNYSLARSLYRNINDKYKLGAGFSKPVIDTTVGFMGTPHFSVNDENFQGILSDIENRWSGKFIRIHRDTLRDGDCFVRIERVKNKLTGKLEFDLELIPPEFVTPILNPLTGSYSKVIIKHIVPVYDDKGNITRNAEIIETITENEIAIESTGGDYLEVEGIQENMWDLIPIVHFKNEAEVNQLFGVSELEAIEPFMKVYHDTMLFAVQGAKLFARPKVKFSLNSIQKFLEDNFDSNELKSGKLRFQDKEIFLLQEGEDVSFITADSGLSAITTLLEFIYYCIVDVSETPEFAFGTAVQSSKASVSEQMIPLARKIRRKRTMFEEYYQELISTFLAMYSKINNFKLDTDIRIDWDEISPKNDLEIATTINNLVAGLVNGVNAGIISVQSASEFLKEYIPSMVNWTEEGADDSELKRIAMGYAMRQRLEDGLIEQAINNE